MSDAAVHRDSFDFYAIPGTSLAGVLREHFTQIADAAAADALFGHCADGSGKENRASSLTIGDARLIDFDGNIAADKFARGEPVLYPSLRAVQQCVRIGNDTMTAEEGGKFDLEIVPAGTRFACEIIHEARGSAGEAEVAWLVGALGQKMLRFGGAVTRGLGSAHAMEVETYRLDLSRQVELDAWSERPYGMRDAWPKGSGFKRPLHAPSSAEKRSSSSHRYTGRLLVDYKTVGPLLVGGSQDPLKSSASGADLLFVEFPFADYTARQIVYKAMIPGSAIKGVLRHRVRHIMECVGRGGEAEATGAAMFGHIGNEPATDRQALTDKRGADGAIARAKGKESAQKGRVAVRSCPLNTAAYTAVQHVAIDRSTGGSLIGALYSEAPIWAEGLKVAVSVDVNGVSATELALLLYALLDVGQERLPIGGGGNRGNGRLAFAEPQSPFAGQIAGSAGVFNLDNPVDLPKLLQILDVEWRKYVQQGVAA